MPHKKATVVNTETSIWTTGLAMFSMFFGAGNVVFPLALGQLAQDNNFFAITGLLLTAVGVPFLGLIAMSLFAGNYHHFFERIGKVPGFLIALIIMGLIGPLGAMPRCIALSYSTIGIFLPDISLPLFSIFSCLLIFAFTFRKNNIIDVLGIVLTPLLLISLILIVIKGIWGAEEAPISPFTPGAMFMKGLNDGYQTMDLLATFFFSSIVLSCLKKDVVSEEHQNYKKLVTVMLKASCVGAFLLSVIYVGFSYVAAFHSPALEGVLKDQLAAVVALRVLGPFGGIIACIAVALACLTTAIALAAVFAEFLQKEVMRDKLGYLPSLILTLVAAYFVSTLNFTGIVAFLAPILQVCYPALIALTVLNILFKLYHFKPVKIPVALVFVTSLLNYFLA